MTTWLEEVEIKHADLERVIRFFSKMHEIWLSVAKDSEYGRAAFARKQAQMYKRMELDASDHYTATGIVELRCREGSSDTLADRVMAFREREFGDLVGLSTTIPPPSIEVTSAITLTGCPLCPLLLY